MTIRTRQELLDAITPLVDASWTDVQLTDFIESVALGSDLEALATAAGALRHQDTQVTHAQLLDLVANPVLLTPGPGLDGVVDPISVLAVHDNPDGAYTADPADIFVSSGQEGAANFSGLRITHFGFTQARLVTHITSSNIDGVPEYVYLEENDGVYLRNQGGDLTGGGAGNTLSLRVYYRIEPAVPFGA